MLHDSAYQLPIALLQSMHSIPRSIQFVFRSSAKFCQGFPTSSNFSSRPTTFSRFLFIRSSSSITMTNTNQGGESSKKSYHKKATGTALATVRDHTMEEDLKLYGSCFWYVSTFEHFFAVPTNISKPFRATRVDLARAQKGTLPVYRNRSLQEAPVSP